MFSPNSLVIDLKNIFAIVLYFLALSIDIVLKPDKLPVLISVQRVLCSVVDLYRILFKISYTYFNGQRNIFY